MSVKNGNEVRVEKLIKRPVKDVFKALAEGRLFNNCGAALNRIQIDFKVGGQYQLFFQNVQLKLCGKFTEIVPDKRIRFTWGDSGSDPGFPRSDVRVELVADGQSTRVTIEHTGFATQEDAEAHEGGWCSGLEDLESELIEGRLRLLRTYPVGRDKLYAACSDVRKLFASVADTSRGELDFRVGGQYRFPTEKGEIRGQFEEIAPGQKIVMSWLVGCGGPLEKPSRVTLVFDDEEDGESSLALLHEGLPLDEVRVHREGWEHFVSKIL